MEVILRACKPWTIAKITRRASKWIVEKQTEVHKTTNTVLLGKVKKQDTRETKDHNVFCVRL
ncbi:rCG48508, partial [Rattus norvegicus]